MHDLYFKKIEIAANASEKLLEKFRIKEIPIDPEAIASKLGIEVHRTSFEKDEVSGVFIKKNKLGNPIIAVNQNHSPERQRFTIAHEIGHYILHSMDSIQIDTNLVHFRDNTSAKATSIKEIQANQFAATLLMPQEKLVHDIKECIEKKEDINISALANKYKVSQQAMTIRVGKILA